MKRIAYLHGIRIQKIEDVLAQYNLTYSEYLIIIELKYKEFIQIEEVINKVDLDKKMIFQLLNSLKDKGYIEIKENEVILSEKYNKIHLSLKKDIHKIDHNFRDSINDDEYHQLIDTLDKMIYSHEE
jgi:DNA-binding MarR family transcriptional regulator